MYRPAFRTLQRSALTRSLPRTPGAQRFASTTSRRTGSWKGTAVRWGLAGSAIYYYKTSNIFAEEPAYSLDTPITDQENENLPTIDAIAAQRKQRLSSSSISADATSSSTPASSSLALASSSTAAPGSPEALEEEAGQEGAFNPETGEINWGCPCLGGMAEGPCGPQFKEAFSCFVFSKEEPKGVDCIDKFKGMQDCFREHPEIYGAELEDDEEVAAAEAADATGEAAPIPANATASLDNDASNAAPSSSASASRDPADSSREKVAHNKPLNPPPADKPEKQARAQQATVQVKKEHETTSESDDLVPKSWHDAK
ncbi:hypothetical protein LTS18_005386 [Coniosporium uncinatum]|uniref:Uncharacterized protein n=1 Tax=Coniosporium uncinatum TaxID=93489 RepID=A0ACC3D4M6_9PEZI|nr:hypothetical protein LTS18_005386 [Coniosporium uncinatum]